MSERQKYTYFSEKKNERDPLVPEYLCALEAAYVTYNLTPEAFVHNLHEVFQGAARLLSMYEVDIKFNSHPERSLLLLALADAWISTQSVQEKKSLLVILKLVVCGALSDTEYGTYSGRVLKFSSKNQGRGTLFDPNAESGNTYKDYIEYIYSYIDEHTDEELTNAVFGIVSDYSDSSKLAHVRNKLHVSKETEHIFSVAVLNKTAWEMAQEIGYTAFYVSRNDSFVAVFNSNMESSDSLEHEYAHSQSTGVNRWYQTQLFRGVNEALTEGATSRPSSYPQQRKFLRDVLAVHPEYEELLYQVYIGDEDARVQLLSTITADYGLQGLLIFARVSPIDNPKMSGNIGEFLYIAPHEAFRRMTELSKN